MTNKKLHIERHLSYGALDSFIIEGLSPKEMNSILDADTWEQKTIKLQKLLNEYDNDYRDGYSLGDRWARGYGIYGIRHFGGHLIVDIGKSCD